MTDPHDETTQAELLTLEEMLEPERAEQLRSLSPGITWALDTLVISFREELTHLDGAAREAFVRLTLQYGQHLQRFLELAHREVSPDEVAERQRKMALLRGLPLFAQLNDFDLSQIAGAFAYRTYQRGEVMVREGQPGDAVYFLDRGRLGVFAAGNQVAVRGPGNLFGEMSCLTDTPATATLRAVDECHVLVISKADFEEYVLKLPETVPQFARMGVGRLADITHRLSEVLSHMPDALLKLDRQGIVTGDVSSKCFAYLDREVLTGERFSALLFRDHPAKRQAWDEAYPALWTQPERCNDPALGLPRDTTFRMGDGDLRYYELTLFPSHEKGALAGFDVAIADTTERRQVEAERARMERALRNVVRKFLTFRLGEEVYAIEVERAREILGAQELTRVPRGPGFLRGVFNLRGRILPAVDLRSLLGLPRSEPTRYAVVVVETPAETGEQHPIGLVVDEVTDILDIAESDIEPSPEFGPFARTGFIQGLGKTAEGVRIVLAVEALLSPAQLAALDAAAPAQAAPSDAAPPETPPPKAAAE